MDKRMITRAMGQPDDLVITLEYVDSKGQRTERVISPIRFMGGTRFLALCLCRCEPRQFDLSRCSNVRLRPADQFVMPVPMQAAS